MPTIQVTDAFAAEYLELCCRQARLIDGVQQVVEILSMQDDTVAEDVIWSVIKGESRPPEEFWRAWKRALGRYVSSALADFQVESDLRCPNCQVPVDQKWIRQAARILKQREATEQGRILGRPRLMRTCNFCKREFTAREFRAHKPGCDAWKREQDMMDND